MAGVATNSDGLRDAYLAYLKPVKKCDDGTSGCFISDNMSLLNGDPESWYLDSSALLADGTQADFYWDGGTDCEDTTGTISDICGQIYVDVNGFKPPNIVGRDIFEMWVRKDGLSPKGTAGDGLDGDCIITAYGYSCAAKYLGE